jgi:hypothetical protein
MTAKERVEALMKELHLAQRVQAEEECAARLERQRQWRVVAGMAHDLLCQYNHTDGCSWMYEVDGTRGAADKMWECSGHQHWLYAAERCGEKFGMGPDAIEAMLRRVVEVRGAYPRVITILREGFR